MTHRIVGQTIGRVDGADKVASVRIATDLTVLGKIGEFGQPIIRSKADALLAEFARNLGAALAE